MLGDNPSSFTNLTDRNLYNQISPSRRKSDVKFASSSSSSPHLRKSPIRTFSSQRTPQKPITIFDQIVDWFHGKLEVRKRYAALTCGYISTLTYILVVSLLKLRIWTPFSSLQDSLTWWMYPSAWVSILLIHGISSALAYSHIRQFCKVTQLQRIPITDANGWAGASLEFVHRLVFLYIAFAVSDCSFRHGFAWIAISFSAAVSSAFVIFKSDYYLRFSDVQVKSVKTLVEFSKSLPHRYLFDISGFDATLSFGSGMALILFVAPAVWGFSAWWLLINFPFNIVLFAVNFIHQAYAKIFVQIVNQIVMMPMKFAFPPSYAVHSPTPEETRTLPNVIETADPLLRMFAFQDLRVIAWSDPERRVDVFSLSQPGKHPRNWKAVSTPCNNALDHLCMRIIKASRCIAGYEREDESDIQEAEKEEVPPKEALMMPRIKREMTYHGNGQSRQQRNIAPIRTINTQNVGFFGKISRFFGHTSEKLVISRYDAQLNAYASEALYMLIIDSLSEDRFGVVQKDLKDLISLLCRLIYAIDMYDRARASVADKSDVTFLRLVDASLKASLQRVVAAFGSHLKSLNLPEQNVLTIRMVCLTDEI